MKSPALFIVFKTEQAGAELGQAQPQLCKVDQFILLTSYIKTKEIPFVAKQEVYER